MTTPAIWFPTIQTKTGTDIFTTNLVRELTHRGIRAEISWLEHHKEYLPWTTSRLKPPEWANLVHVNSWLPHSLLPKTLPVITTVHHAIHRLDFRPYKSTAQALYHRYWIAPNERKVLQSSAKRIAVSLHVARATQEDLIDLPIDVIYNGVNINRFLPAEKIEKRIFQLLFVGTWRKGKGVDLLAPIMKQLGHSFELLYTGLTEHSIGLNMINIGHVSQSDLIKLMQQADALLFPTRSEGMPLVVLEALSCGLPTVTTRIPPLNEFIKDGQNGYLVDKDDVKGFVKKIRALAASEELQRRVRRRARQSVISSFSDTTMVDRYIEAYRRAL